MSGKKDTQVRKISDRITDDIKFRAIDLLHGIKENWTRSEKRRFAAWLLDPKAGDWGDDYKAPLRASTLKIVMALVMVVVFSMALGALLFALALNA